MIDITGAKFQFDRFLATPGGQTVDPASLFTASGQHLRVEQSQCCEEDHQSNLDALESGERIFTVHLDAQGHRFYIITDAVFDGDPLDRRDCATTVLRPEEY
ncbi:MAG: hypothetical protein HC824_15800 [Synechococcales cyanobacterium RM1_1_8]|nr:hypothetical protein [Synechococcales cyanobacterium RM1_1_8]